MRHPNRTQDGSSVRNKCRSRSADAEQKRQHKQINWQDEQVRRNATTAADIQRGNAKTAADIASTDLTTHAEIIRGANQPKPANNP